MGCVLRGRITLHGSMPVSNDEFLLGGAVPSPGGKVSGVRRGQFAAGQICALRRNRIGAWGWLAWHWPDRGPYPAKYQRCIDTLPKPSTKRRGPQLCEAAPAHFAERQNPHGRQACLTIESMTGRRAASNWVGNRLESGLRMVRTANGPVSQWGRFCCAEAETWDARSTWRPATA